MLHEMTSRFYVAFNANGVRGGNYKYTVSNGWTAYTAYETSNGFAQFLDNYGLTIDKASVQLHDGRARCDGIVVTFSLTGKPVRNEYFWHMSEIPAGAKRFVALENGNYVNCYALTNDVETVIYRPNPNAKDVYVPYDYFAARKLYA